MSVTNIEKIKEILVSVTNVEKNVGVLAHLGDCHQSSLALLDYFMRR